MLIQYSVHAPSDFIQTHLDQLLPGWTAPVLSVLVILQACQLALLQKTPETESLKLELRHQFLDVGFPIAHQLQQQGYWADLFDPETGWPLISPPGFLRLDDVAVVHSSLGYPLIARGGCALIEHPEWGNAVYPSILVSSAPPEVFAAVIEEIPIQMNSC